MEAGCSERGAHHSSKRKPEQEHHLANITKNVLSFLSIGDLASYLSCRPGQSTNSKSAAQSKHCSHKRPQKQQRVKAPEHTGEEGDDPPLQDSSSAVLDDDDACSIPEEGLGRDRSCSCPECEAESSCCVPQTPLATPQSQQQHHHSNPIGALVGSIVWVTLQPSVIAFSLAKGGASNVLAIIDKLPLLALLQVCDYFHFSCSRSVVGIYVC